MSILLRVVYITLKNTLRLPEGVNEPQSQPEHDHSAPQEDTKAEPLARADDVQVNPKGATRGGVRPPAA